MPQVIGTNNCGELLGYEFSMVLLVTTRLQHLHKCRCALTLRMPMASQPDR